MTPKRASLPEAASNDLAEKPERKATAQAKNARKHGLSSALVVDPSETTPFVEAVLLPSLPKAIQDDQKLRQALHEYAEAQIRTARVNGALDRCIAAFPGATVPSGQQLDCERLRLLLRYREDAVRDRRARLRKILLTLMKLNIGETQQ